MEPWTGMETVTHLPNFSPTNFEINTKWNCYKPPGYAQWQEPNYRLGHIFVFHANWNISYFRLFKLIKVLSCRKNSYRNSNYINYNNVKSRIYPKISKESLINTFRAKIFLFIFFNKKWRDIYNSAESKYLIFHIEIKFIISYFEWNYR